MHVNQTSNCKANDDKWCFTDEGELDIHHNNGRYDFIWLRWEWILETQRFGELVSVTWLICENCKQLYVNGFELGISEIFPVRMVFTYIQNAKGLPQRFNLYPTYLTDMHKIPTIYPKVLLWPSVWWCINTGITTNFLVNHKTDFKHGETYKGNQISILWEFRIVSRQQDTTLLWLPTGVINLNKSLFFVSLELLIFLYLFSNAPVTLSRFSHYDVHTFLTPTFRRNWCWFRLDATLCHDVLRCFHAIATPEPRYCPVLTRLTSDTGKLSCIVLRYVSLPPRSSLAVATLSYALPRIWRSIACRNEPET